MVPAPAPEPAPAESAAAGAATPPTPADSPAERADPPAPGRPHWKRDIVCFLSAQAFSMLGSSLVGYTVIWYLVGNASAAVYSIGLVCNMLPQGLISIFGGVWADRHNRKFLIIGTDAAIAVATIALALLMFSGTAPVVAIIIVLALRSAGGGVQGPAVGGMVAQIVPTKHLMRVNSINATLQPIIFLVAPAVAGVLFTIAAPYGGAGLAWVFLIDPVGAAIAIALTLTIPLTKVARPAGEPDKPNYARDLKEGLKLTWGRPDLRRIGLLLIVSFLIMFPAGNLLPIAVKQQWGAEAWRLAAVEIAWSGGMMLGGALLAVWGADKDRMKLIVGSTLAMGVATMALGFGYWFWLLIGLTALYGFICPFFWTTGMTAIQETVEPHFQGRVLAIASLIMALAGPLGLLIAGPFADVVSIYTIFLVCGILGTALTAALSFKVPKLAPVIEQNT